MKLPAINATAGGILAVAAVAAVGVLWWNRKAIGQAVGSAAQLVNPISDRNVAYGATNAVGGALTGTRDFSLGSWLWEKLNPEAVERERQATIGPAPSRPLVGTSGDFARMDRIDYYASAGVVGSNGQAPDNGTGYSPDVGYPYP